MRVAGLVLAAGAGTRLGRPKGLMRDAGGLPWVRLAVASMRDAGCEPVVVVTGASGPSVAELVLPGSASVVFAAGWVEGMGASLRAGLEYLGELDEPPDAVVVGLVDMPDVTAAVVARLLDPVTGVPHLKQALVRAAYGGRPGHPVLLGREHWAGVAAAAQGDVGARHYLRGREDVVLVEVGDLASGEDIDTLPTT